jgi:hypothetical protein
MENPKQDQHKVGCLPGFLILPLLFEKNVRPVALYSVIIVSIGAALYHWLEDWSWLDSFYFVIVTLTTIGYGDLSPTSSLTKVITIFYALNGVAILLTLLTEIQRVRREHMDNLRGYFDEDDS